MVYIDDPNVIYTDSIKKNLSTKLVSENKPTVPVPTPLTNFTKCFIIFNNALIIENISTEIPILHVLAKNLTTEMSDLDDVVYSELDFWVDKGFIVADELLRELGSVVRNDSRRSVSDVILAVLSDSMVGS